MRIIYRWPSFLERLVYYFFIPELVAKVIYEIILRVPALSITQPKQYMFYAFVALEYLLLILNYKDFKPAFRKVNIVWILLVIMLAHGVIVGLWWKNPISRMGVDTVNVFVVLANILILSDPRKVADTAFDRIFYLNRLYGVVMILLSIVAVAVNPTSGIKLGSAAASALAMTLVYVEIYTMRVLTPRTLVRVFFGVLLIAATAQDWNRTTLVFNGVAILALLARRAGAMPFRTMYLAMAAVLTVGVAFMVLPEDSALSRRISGLNEVDLSDRTGSIGEREAEADAVHEKISSLGEVGQIFGAGHGASYDVKYTWEWKIDYSNAHYGWILFYLRYGMLGYLYISVWILVLVLSAATKWRSPTSAGILVFLLCIWNIGYLGTYGYFSFFIAGLPFMTPVTRVRIPTLTDDMVASSTRRFNSGRVRAVGY